MKSFTLFLTATILAMAGSAGYAQSRAVPSAPPASIASEVLPATLPDPFTPKVTAGFSPLKLRSGATATGLWGFYDYQSNGASPYCLYVEPGNPQHIHVTYMLSLDSLNVSPSRRVGYAYSANGGTSWKVSRDIGAIRLGFPRLQVATGSIGMIAAHGLANTGRIHSLLYVAGGAGDTSFVSIDLPEATSAGRIDQGLLWPMMALSKDQTKAFFGASISNNTGTGAAPMQVATVDLLSGQVIGGKWKDLADSSVSSSSGGRDAMAVSLGGKIGLAYYHSSDTGAVPVPAGVFFTESSNNGVTWSTPQRVWGNEIVNDPNINLNGDQDTTTGGLSMDMAYIGEEPHLVFDGSLNNLYRFESIFHWTPSKGVTQVATVDVTRGIGCALLASRKGQPNMSPIGYPTISTGDDGQHLVVCFNAVASMVPTGDSVISDENGFNYYRVWGVGSTNGGTKWGDPFIVQDFGGSGTDSASCEYPFANKAAKMNGANYDFSLVYQARRHPGMFAFVSGSTSDTGIVNACYQYYQAMSVTPAMFRSSVGVNDWTGGVASGYAIRTYPNPANTVAAIEYSVPTAGTVSLVIYNALGQEVLRPVTDEHGPAGSFVRTVDLRALTAGSYRCVLSHNNGVRIVQMLNVVR